MNVRDLKEILDGYPDDMPVTVLNDEFDEPEFKADITTRRHCGENVLVIRFL